MFDFDALDDAFDDAAAAFGGELGPVLVEGVGFDSHGVGADGADAVVVEFGF